jgi:type IX secretion system substrate protein
MALEKTKDTHMKTFIILISVLCFSCLVHAQTLKQAEYFIDKDKGFGKNNKLNLASSADSSYGFTINLSGISIGQHKLYVRTKDNKGKWSETIRENIDVVISSALPVITAGEYFFDVDPGYGKANKIVISNKDTVTLQNFTAAVSNLKEGFHKLYIRIKDNENSWGITLRENTEVVKTEEPVKIIAAEYFFSNDPGFKKATTNMFSKISADSTFKFKIAYKKIPSNADTLFIRTEDSLGKWSLTKIALFNVQSLVKEAIASNAKINVNSSELRVFPNPATDILNYNFKGINNKTTITILNSNGVTVRKYQPSAGETGQINISSLSAGVYLLQVDDGIRKQTVQFIKQ